jgi:hypothetical protein
MSNYISDDQVIINLQGLRWVKKSDTQYTTYNNYGLEWDYKGGHGTHTYTSQEKRDEMFNRLRTALAVNEVKEAKNVTL